MKASKPALPSKAAGKSAAAPPKYGKPAAPGKAFGQSLKGVGRAGKGKGKV